MGRLDVRGLNALDEFIQGCRDLGLDVDTIADECLDEASPTLVEALQSKIIQNTTDEATGELASSIEATDARMNAYGHFVAVRPTGSGSNGVRNGEKLAYLEYGVASRNRPAKPCMAAAIAMAEPQVTETIRKRFEEQAAKRLKQ